MTTSKRDPGTQPSQATTTNQLSSQQQQRTLQQINNQYMKNKKPDGGPDDSEEDNNTLICKNSPIYLNSTLKGGYRAGNYTNLGRVSDMSECVRLCCDNSRCNAALMLESNCFFVECKNADGCLPVIAKSTHAVTALNPRVSFITSRSEEGWWLDPSSYVFKRSLDV